MKLRYWLGGLGVGFLLLASWILWDLFNPRTHDLRKFDGHEVARLETAMWRSYYDHQPVKLFGQLTQLLRTQYGFPFWRSVAGGFYAARAAEVFQTGHARAEYMRALPDLVSYYTLVHRTTTPPFDVNKTAALELEWWIIHRERATYGKKELDQSLADLQAEIYGRPAGDFAEHAGARADAMELRDERAESGSPSADDWRRIGQMLDVSWTSIQRTVAGARKQN
jgi:hypothetical protein